VRAVELRDVSLLHLQQRRHHPVGALAGLFYHLRDHTRHDLPRHSVAVLEPAALLRLRVPTDGEALPVVVHFVLAVAIHLKRDRFVEPEERPTVERSERLALELEGDRHHRAGRAPMDLIAGVAIPADRDDARVLENAGVVLRRFLGLVVEPEARRDALNACHLMTSYPVVVPRSAKST